MYPGPWKRVHRLWLQWWNGWDLHRKKKIRISLPLLNHFHFIQNAYRTNTIFLIFKMGINSSDHKESIYVLYIKCMWTLIRIVFIHLAGFMCSAMSDQIVPVVYSDCTYKLYLFNSSLQNIYANVFTTPIFIFLAWSTVFFYGTLAEVLLAKYIYVCVCFYICIYKYMWEKISNRLANSQ